MKNETTLRSHLSLSDEATEPSHLPLTAIQELHRHWVFFFALGAALLSLGTMGILMAGLFTLASVVIFGWLLVIAGAGVTMHAFWAKQWSGFFLQLLSVSGCRLYACYAS
jgi:uncharacterized membrane protein HdeD (DUF308 family)